MSAAAAGEPAGGPPGVSVVVLAYGDEPLLQECVGAVLTSVGVRVEVVLVDNGCTSDAVARLDGTAGLRLVTPGANSGFAGGCDLGAAATTAPVVAFVNSDAIVEPGAVAALVAALDDPGTGIASGSLRLRERPDVMNSAGNPVHYLGLSWAGGLGEPATSYARARVVTGATGAVMAVRRQTWEALGGFYEPLFAYHEDVELSLRCWQRGWAVVYVPDAVALHAYEFHRHPEKMYLMERNRLLVVLTLYERRTLWLVAVPLLGLEIAVLAVSVRQGWWRQKVRGWWWLARHAALLRARRASVQAARTVPDSAVAPLLSGSFSPGDISGFAAPAPLAVASSWWWAGVRRLIR
jgi:GT2 family glycosyltransferase